MDLAAFDRRLRHHHGSSALAEVKPGDFDLDVSVGPLDRDVAPLGGKPRQTRGGNRGTMGRGDPEEARPDKTQTWEFWERAGNWGPPFMLLVMGGAFALSRKDLLGGYEEPEITDSTIDTIFFLCKLCLALLLIGHAGFGFAVQKQMLIDHWQSIGVKADATFISQIGYAELGLGILIFLAPVRPLVFLALGWKLFTEFLSSRLIRLQAWGLSISSNGSKDGAITEFPWLCFTYFPTGRKGKPSPQSSDFVLFGFGLGLE